MSMYAQFKTDETLEVKGIDLDYGDFRVTIARAGGANKTFARMLERHTKKYRRAIDTETMDNDVAMAILRKVYAEVIVLNWQTRVEDKFVKGIENPDGGKVLPVTADNILATFDALPDLFNDIKAQADKAALFRQDILEAAAGN